MAKPGPSNDSRVDALLARLGIEVHGTEGKELVATCPWCTGQSLHVEAGKGVWICRKGCGGGNLFQLAERVLKGDKAAANQALEECGFPRRSNVRKLEGGKGKPVDALAELAAAKGAPREGFERLGAEQVGPRSHEVRIPMHDEALRVVGWQRINVSSRDEILRKGKTVTGAQTGLFLERSAPPKPGSTVCLVEGPKDAAWLLCNGYSAVGLPGCRLHPRYAALFAGVHVVLVPDRDATARRSIERNARALVGHAASIRLAILPFEETEKGGKDVRDAARELGVQAVHQAIETARPWLPSDAERARAVLHWDGVEVHGAATEASTVLEQAAQDPASPQTSRVFAAAGGLARVLLDGTGGPYLQRITKAVELVDALSGCSEWLAPTSKGDVKPCPPPTEVAWAILQRGVGTFPALEDIRRTPALRWDGTVVLEPGYDASTQSFSTFRPELFASIPQHPKREDAEEAVAKLCEELFGEVHFRDRVVDRYAGLAMFLTACARKLFSKAPFFFVAANGRGAGKTVFADAVAHAATGRAAAFVPSLRGGEEELQKLMASHLAAGASAILIDEAGGVVKSSTLNSLATQESVNFRLLGANDVPRLSTRVTLMATGNGLHPSSDLCRRVVTVNLEAGENAVARRYSRSITDEARDRHIEWVCCGLTILSAWMQSQERKRIGSGEPPYLSTCGFPQWSNVVRGAVHWITEADPATSLFDAIAEDPEDEDFAGLLLAWRLEFGADPVTSTDLVQRASSTQTLRDALILAGCSKSGNVELQRVAYLLRGKRGARAGGYQLCQAQRRTSSKKEPTRWQVLPSEGGAND